MALTKVSGAIASKNGITLFFPTGQSAVYGQDSWRTGDLLKAVLLPLASANGEPIEVDLQEFSLAKAVEQATGGTMKVEEKVEDGVSKIALTTTTGEKLENAQTLSEHIERAAYEGSPGLSAFLERFAKVKHKDTAQEVLRFMEKVDLPLADDGCLVLYKFLDAAADEGYYVDHHTKKVRQRIGSRVYMDAKDYLDTRDSCGTGLHVCAASYGQYGNRILLVKVRPEDVVAVPHHESSKMRVLAYHIVAALDQTSHAAVSEKRSALTAKGAKGVVAEVVAGQHIGVIEEVLVGKQGEHTVKVLEKVEVTTKRNKARPIKGKPKAPDAKTIKQAIKKAKQAVTDVQAGREPQAAPGLVGGALVRLDHRGKPVTAKIVDGDTALVDGAWVSVERLTVVGEAPSPAPKVGEPTTQLTGKAQAEHVAKATRIKEGRREEAKVQTITPEYRAKLDKAQEMLTAGSTLRQIDKALGMCRKSLARHIALGNLKG